MRLCYFGYLLSGCVLLCPHVKSRSLAKYHPSPDSSRHDCTTRPHGEKAMDSCEVWLGLIRQRQRRCARFKFRGKRKSHLCGAHAPTRSNQPERLGKCPQLPSSHERCNKSHRATRHIDLVSLFATPVDRRPFSPSN